MIFDLKCDVGELEDSALEAALMEHITTANIACGAHAGDDSTMLRTIRLALERGVRIGAHPGYADRSNFGRIELAMTPDEVERSIYEQILRLETHARACGVPLSHVKPHGALYNLAARDEETARAIGRAAAGWRRNARIFGLAGSHALDVWRAMGLEAVPEGFADRRYEPDGSLRSRRLPGALIENPDEAAAQAVSLVRAGRAATICVHGDTPGAPTILRACRAAFTAATGS
jgi:UPF0271 protein